MNELQYLELQDQAARRRLQDLACCNRMTGFVRDHPVVIAAIAVAAGAVIGRLVIRSRLGWVGALAWAWRAGGRVARPALRIVASSLTGV